MSNVLSIPLVALNIQTGNNEDWIDSLKYLVEIPDASIDDYPQLDLRNIIFDMEIRRATTDPEVLLAASTRYDTLQIGVPPDFGYLIINIPLADMRGMKAGNYVGDIVGHDDFYTRKIAEIALEIIEGITKQPVNKRVVVEAA
jgi:hypothetical protein